jgi:hypothetical protein
MSSTSILRSVWLHVHVPKAGGSTLRQLMNRNFGKAYYNSNSLLETKQYTREDVSEIVRCHPWVECFSDHKLSLDLPYNSPYADVKALCYVRQPTERFISRYFFHRHFEEVNCLAQRMSFRDFAEAELVRRECHPQTNSQIYFLNGGRSFEDLSFIEEMLGTGQVFLFPIERFDESCICLEQLFPAHFSDLSYVLANVSRKDVPIERRDRDFAAEQLQQDLPVWDLANEFLNRLLATTFANQNDSRSSLAEFQDRCSRRFHNFFPPVAPGEPVPPVGTIPAPTKPAVVSTPTAPAEESPVDPRFAHLAKAPQPTLPTEPPKPTLPTLPEE